MNNNFSKAEGSLLPGNVGNQPILRKHRVGFQKNVVLRQSASKCIRSFICKITPYVIDWESVFGVHRHVLSSASVLNIHCYVWGLVILARLVSDKHQLRCVLVWLKVAISGLASTLPVLLALYKSLCMLQILSDPQIVTGYFCTF